MEVIYPVPLNVHSTNINKEGVTMGWTSYNADIFRNGKVDRKLIREICDDQLTWTDENGIRKVLKSAMVGSTYYAAVEHIMPNGNRRVWAAVTLTSTNKNDYFNFSYKGMDETVCPGECKCPIGILNLLTETEYEYAKEWRKACYDYHTKQKEKRRNPSLGSLPLGSEIEFEIKGRGVFRAKKINYWKFKRPVWAGSGYRFPLTVIPDDWKLVEAEN